MVLVLWLGHCTRGFDFVRPVSTEPSSMRVKILIWVRGHVNSPPSAVAGWRLIFLITGMLTIGTVPLVWWIIDGDVLSSRFLNEHDKRMVIERLRANQTGTGSHEFKWAHVRELFIDPKTYLCEWRQVQRAQLTLVSPDAHYRLQYRGTPHMVHPELC